MEQTKKQELLYARGLIEASLHPMAAVGVSGKISDINKAFAAIAGIGRAEIVGSDFFGYFTEPLSVGNAYREALKTGLLENIPVVFRHSTGSVIDVRLNSHIYTDDQGNIIGAIVVLRDASEQEGAIALQKANNKLAFQTTEREQRANELAIANTELVFQNREKGTRAAELAVANEELVFQNDEKEKRAAELAVANKELAFQNEEKEKRAEELAFANSELLRQIREKEAQELFNKALEAANHTSKQASQYTLSLIEASLDPLVTISTEGKIMDMNNATVNITGIDRATLTGSDFFDYFTDPQKAREVYQEVFAKGSVADSPLTLRHKEGKLTDVLFNGSVFKDEDGNVSGVVIVARDVTDQSRIEKELTEAIVFAEIATGIAEEAKQKAESATLTAENAVKAKQQILSNMSHEIRTPMNAIIGFTKVVLKTELTAKQKEYLTAIKQSGDALIVLINDILDLAKVDAGKMSFEQVPFKLSSSIASMLHLFETKIQEKNLELVREYDISIPEVVVGDPVRLHQIILNLVSNAVKFTTRGTITVSVRLLSEDEEEAIVEFAVSDTGIGIREDKIENIFENFQQASSDTSRLYGGTGLGLAIVNQLINAQNGTIAVKSKVGEGSVFSFTLSFRKTKAQPELEPDIVEMADDVRNIKVLVVEDIPLNQLLMKTLLDDFGFERDIAANGRIAIEKLKAKSYDIILMDLQMPEMNGFEATSYIRKKMHSKIPIIALTADVTTVDLEKCKAVDMDDYIAKPVDEKLLYNKIVSLVMKPVVSKKSAAESADLPGKKQKCTDLNYLLKRTKSNRGLMMEMISAYLEQTPPLVNEIKQSLQENDWSSLNSAIHKILPSFSIMGMSPDFVTIAKKVQEYAASRQEAEKIYQLVSQIEDLCAQACEELEEEYNTIKNSIV